MYNSLVLKVGTNVLTRPNGRLDVTNISAIVDQIAWLKAAGVSLVLVSSGAVGAGKDLYEGTPSGDETASRQVYSAIGQVRLMELYRQLFAGHGLHCAQVLATKSDFRDERHTDNMLNCLRALLQDQIVPIVNENDVVAVTELMFTDNDELAGLVARLLGVESLVILTSVDGLFDGDPTAPDSKVVRELSADNEAAESYVQEEKSSLGRGGMATKLRIAAATARAGIPVYLGNGRRPDILNLIGPDSWPGTRITK